MKKTCFIWLFAGIFLLSCSKSPYREIDKALSESDTYEIEYLARIDSVRNVLKSALTDEQKWDCLYELFDLFKHYNSDSTQYYSHLLMQYHGNDPDRMLISQSAEVRSLSRQSYFNEAELLFERLSVSSENTSKAITDYFYAGEVLYSELLKIDPSKSKRKTAELADKYRQFDSTSVAYHLLTAKSLRYNGNPKECIDLLSTLPESRFKEHNYSLYHYNLALAYEELGNTELQLKHLILSANEDLHRSKKDYSSLYSLAMLLFQSGDVQRASSYLGKALKDALQYNYPVGLVRNASASLVVNEILHDSEISQRKRLVVGIAVISSLGLLAIILSLYLRILLRKLRRSNRRLQVTTAKLASTSLIKDSFLAGYMEQAAYYIRKVDENKSQLRRTLKSDGLEGVTALLRSPSYADEEYPNFYKHFDETFLAIFPDFIEYVNKNLATGHFKINKGTHTLNTELRILALIRLGISDPERIAKILHTSKGTVFTYRSKLRHNASCPPEEFENKICEIN